MTVQLPADLWVLTTAALLVAAVLSAAFAGRIQVPGLLLFLAMGMLISDDGFGWVSLSNPQVAQTAGAIGLMLILFEGGLTTRLADVRQVAAPALLMSSVGVLVTAAIVGGGAALLLDVAPLTALLIGAVVASTDAAAVFSLLRRTPLPRRLTALLEVESGANDPVAIMLTIGLVTTWQGTVSATDWVSFALLQLAGGLTVGVVAGLAGSWLLSRPALGGSGVYPVLALAVAGLSYGGAAQLGGSGFLAVYVTGLLVGARATRYRPQVISFHESLANTAEVILFLLLGMLVFPSHLPPVAGAALVVTGLLVLVARPVATAACLVWFGYRARELAFVSWVGLRGAVPIVLATFPAAAGHPDGELVFNVVFFVVLVSAAVQGATVSTAARLLGLSPRGDVEDPAAAPSQG